MTSLRFYLRFIADNAPYLAVGVLLMMLSSFGQTFFIAIFGGDIRAEFGLSNGEWGLIFMAGTGFSALVMLAAGGLVDLYRVRSIGLLAVGLLGLSCLAMAFNTSAVILPVIVFALRFLGQGMVNHVAMVAMARWFIATRGRAMAIASLGFMLAEGILPLTLVWMKNFFTWQQLWIGSAIFAFASIPLLHRLLRLERTPQSVAEQTEATGMDDRHWTRAQVLRHPLFWALAPSLLFFPAFGTAFWFHQVHFAEIKGWDHLSLVAVFPIGTATFMASTFAYGWAIDRFGAGRLFPIYLLPLCLAFTLHWYAPTVAWSAAGVVCMGLAGGGQATLPMVLWAEYYGTRHMGAIKSAVVAVMVLGSAIGPGLTGWLIDAGFAYDRQLLVYAASFFVASLVSILPLRRATLRLRKETRGRMGIAG